MNQVNIFAALTLCLLVVKRVTAFGPAKKPHVMFILVDDLGHAELGYNREVPTKEVIAKAPCFPLLPNKLCSILSIYPMNVALIHHTHGALL